VSRREESRRERQRRPFRPAWLGDQERVGCSTVGSNPARNDSIPVAVTMGMVRMYAKSRISPSVSDFAVTDRVCFSPGDW